MRTAQMTVTAMMTAITCIIGPIALPIPVSPVPISLINLAVFLMAYVPGGKYATASYTLYLLIALTGLPVLGGFTGGLGKVAGPTGGYLVGFIFLAMIAGYFVEKFPKSIPLHVTGMALGMAVSYLCGTLWLAAQLGISFTAGLGVGVIPYLPGDAVKIILAVTVGPTLKKSVSQAMANRN